MLRYKIKCIRMQNTSPLLWKKFDIWDQNIFEVIQALHIVRIVLYIGCSGPVVGSLSAYILIIFRLFNYLARKRDIQNYVYSMKSLNNFRNALPPSFRTLCILKNCYFPLFVK